MTEFRDTNGVLAKPGMRAQHWGVDTESECLFLGTIREYALTIDGKAIEIGLCFVYDDPPSSQDEQEFVPLMTDLPFEIIEAPPPPQGTYIEHKATHVALHRALDELIADYLAHGGKVPSQATVLELMEWSHRQSLRPT